MTAMITPTIYYPSGDGEPVAETFDHLYVIFITIEVLRLYLQDVKSCNYPGFLVSPQKSPLHQARNVFQNSPLRNREIDFPIYKLGHLVSIDAGLRS